MYGDVLSQQDEGYFIEGQSSRGRVPDISFRPRDRMQQVNLRMGSTVRYGTECKYKCGETAGVLTLLGTSPARIQMNRPPKTREPFGRALRHGERLKSDLFAPAPPVIMPGEKSFYYSLCPSLQCAYSA